MDDPFIELFSEREIAAGIWLFAAIAAAFGASRTRPLVRTIIAMTLRRPIISVLLCYAAYVVGVVALLAEYGLWNLEYIKITVMWFIFSGIAAVIDVASTKDSEQSHFGSWVADNIKALIVVEFLAHAYSFSLVVELALFPVIFVLAGALETSKNDPEAEMAKVVFEMILGSIGLVFLAYSAFQVATNWSQFVDGDPVASFVLPPLLSLALLPFLYLTHLFVWYELIGIRLQYAIPRRFLRAVARIFSAVSFRGDVEALRRWSRNLTWERPQNLGQLIHTIREVKALRRRETQTEACPQHGWNPYVIRTALDSMGITVSDYHRSFDGEWWCNANPHEVQDGRYLNTISYYVYGREEYADRLKLELFLGSTENSDLAVDEFQRAATLLITQAIPFDSDSDPDGFVLEDGSTQHFGEYVASLAVQSFPSGDVEGAVLEICYGGSSAGDN